MPFKSEEKCLRKKHLLSWWPDEKVVKLISAVELHPNLWNIRHPQYGSRKLQAWKNIAIELGNIKDWVDCRAKWQGLQVTYKCNKAKLLKTGNVHWKFYKIMSFIDTPKNKKLNLEDTLLPNSNSSLAVDTLLVNEEIPLSISDEFGTFAEYVASELRCLSREEANSLQNRIEQLIIDHKQKRDKNFRGQIKNLIQLIEESIEVLGSPNYLEKEDKWNSIAETLNSLGPAKQSKEDWQKIWNDIKIDANKKALRVNSTLKIQQQNVEIEGLSEEDLKVLKLEEKEKLGLLKQLASEQIILDEKFSHENSEEIAANNALMENLQWSNHKVTFFEFQKSIKNDRNTCDLKLIFGKKSVLAHQVVLSACSPLLRKLLADTSVGQDVTVIIPEVNENLLDSVLNFIYTGEVSIDSINLNDFQEAISSLGIKSPIISDNSNQEMCAGEIINNQNKKKNISSNDHKLKSSTGVDQPGIIQQILIDENETITTPKKKYEQFNHLASPTRHNSNINQLYEILKLHSPKEEKDIEEVITIDDNGSNKKIDSPRANSSIGLTSNKSQNNIVCIKTDSSSDDDDVIIIDDSDEPITFEDKVNRLRSEQKNHKNLSF